ncbi:uncharacterized protein TRAVEDRAFT_163947 [Trametes versicolor FP-101664 SS1]|uniref:uncharacterized protein n=1 Tax=Trametes versicolor (strain FP-101664) TaxID=717944 RepID=UPI0004622B3A|nr:uncharacterized protein TRAVEDRAFT_163947 [Trametes versicolor FP-101664 SS1]EIW62139.1 hypothetical protein TRAVEDRAFT_163947 [Trametes versicolor FP-101664 SS1]
MPATQSGNTNGHLPAGPAPASAPAARTKQVRVRSPSGSGANEGNESSSADARPPPKRARKAINCEPCRNSKLKCDRNRPCSSCVLRGTTALCYQGQDASDPGFRGAVDPQRAPLDPAVEFSRIRQSLALLESHVYQQPVPRPALHGYVPEPLRRSSLHSPHSLYDRQSPDIDGTPPVKEKTEDVDMTSTPGMLGRQASGGLYAGPTSAASHLISVSDRDDSDHTDRPSSPASPPPPSRASVDGGGDILHAGSGSTATGVWDNDLIAALPPVPIIDGLIQYYFEYCNWIYRHVNEPWLLMAWDRYKSGKHGDRIVLATTCILIALAARYLPPRHGLMQGVTDSPEELGNKCYGIMRDTLQRYRADAASPGRSYSLELVELLLVRCHYLTFAKEDPEETWSVRGELVTIGTAMGLHRDPGSTRFEKTVAERRRWAWWHIILLERWQAFMFGRPLAIASHHFNTQLPSYCDPAIDKSGRLYLPNIALFRLAYILGDIMDDAVSFRTVPYSSVQEKDKVLTDWYESLPHELDLDEFRIARSLASPITAVRRVGVQSVIIRTAYHHIRFTLHRPYAKVPDSLDTAVSAASQLIALVGQTRPDFLSNSALAVPGHMNWGPFHVFSAAMFFSFQLITKPDQPAASLFRENIRKSLASLEQSRWMPVADKALTILQALAPLYSDELLELARDEREHKKAQVLSLVRTLAFPYQDAPYSRSVDSPGYNLYQPGRGSGAGAASQAAHAVYQNHTQAHTDVMHPHQHQPHHHQPILHGHEMPATTQAPISATRWTSQPQSQPQPQSQADLSVAAPQHYPAHQSQHQPVYSHRASISALPASQSQQHHGGTHTHQYSPTNASLAPGQSFPVPRYPTQAQHPQLDGMQQQQQHHAQMFRDAGGAGPGQGHVPPGHELAYVHPADESSMWGASIGFALSEWNSFVDVMQRPDSFAATMVPGPTH